MRYAMVPLLVFLVFAPGFAQTRTPDRRMAVTIDDLPYVRIGDVAYLPNAERATISIVRARTYL